MLRLKRKLGQAVRIANVTDLTVLRLGVNDVSLLEHAPGCAAGTRHELRCGEVLLLLLPRDGRVRVELTAVLRGEALLAFDAVREIAIHRTELVADHPHS